MADRAEVADTSAKRNMGLLRHARLDKGDGLWIATNAVHTFFMKFPIDLVYLDRARRVRKVRQAVGPWRLSGCLVARSVLELPAGTAAETGTQAGDQVVIANVGSA